ncbi:hypothetical protein [Hymenobacter cellulosivorans]|uniref:Uncharacterized protein n=1 Tax=Hymenobacter cellulosivorans TaxID=2932249 RepID=A0ABY4FHD4_9BACT|nr:hypothetical protein [Hymenobacter cellulosivorans]UOQ55428.1 hypothetical protein MUN80_11875 [Hymenobacter cellulosivorans]
MQYLEAIIGNTYIKTDPAGMRNRAVFIANGKKIRTFYVWDPDFSYDPFGYAIYYTITNNMGKPLKSLDPAISRQLSAVGVDLQRVENDYILKSLNNYKSYATISSETKLPISEIRLAEQWAHSHQLLNYPLADQ